MKTELLTALIGFAGVFVGAMITTGVEWIRAHQDLNRDRKFKAIRLAFYLDSFFDSCVDAGLDGGETRPDEHHGMPVTTSTTDNPTFSPPNDGQDLENFDLKILHKVYSIRDKLKDVHGALHSAGEYDIGDGSDYIEERQIQFCELADYVYRTNSQLREKYSLPQRSFEHWNPVVSIRERAKRIRADRIARSRTTKNHSE